MKPSTLTTAQRRALVRAHPSFMYRAKTGYHFQGWVNFKTLKPAFDFCYAPFYIEFIKGEILVGHAPRLPGYQYTVAIFTCPVAAAHYMHALFP